jgi:DNA-binding SARP family transcriptional activator
VPVLELHLLGSPRLERDGAALAFDSRKHLALIAYLAMTGRSHTREALITLLWPELGASRGRAGLRRDLSVIRKILDGRLLVVEGGASALIPVPISGWMWRRFGVCWGPGGVTVTWRRRSVPVA